MLEDGRARWFRSLRGEREGGREGASMFWEPRQLLYGGFDQASGYIEPESRVCVCVCVCVCVWGACGGYSRVLLCLNPHLCVFKLLSYFMFLMSRLLKVCVCVWVVKADGRGPHAATPPSDVNTVTWRWQSVREVEGTVFSRCLATTGSDFLLPTRAH